MAQERTLKLVEPAFLTIEVPGAEKPIREDVYVVRRMLNLAEKKPDEQSRWSAVLDWLAEKGKVGRDRLTENLAIQLNNNVMGLITELNKEIAAQNFTSASLVGSTEAAQQNTPG